MDTLQTSALCDENVNAEKGEEAEMSTAKLEALVTPEQVISASVARRRRTLSKKQHHSRTREQTPGREVAVVAAAAPETTSDEDARAEKRPKTPERRRRKSAKLSLSGSLNQADLENEISTTCNGKESSDQTIIKSESIPKQLEENRKGSLVSTTQNEVVALFHKAKKSLASGRDRIRQRAFEKQPASERSRSVPSQFTERELLESLRKANLLNHEYVVQPRPDNLHSRESSDISSHEDNAKPKPYRPIVQEYVAKKRRQRQYSSKLIEVLDPKTSKVLKKITKGPPEPPMGLFNCLTIFKYVTIVEMCKMYKKFKMEKKEECRKISVLKRKCFTNLLIIMIFCGLGGIMFKHVEGAFENFYKCGVKRVKRDFIDILWYRSHNLREDEWKSLARQKLRIFEEELHAAHEAGMHSYSGQRSWSFLNGIAYCLTVVTTIGYGHMYPTTITGQALTIVYAIIGIPLFLIALTDFGKLFTRGIKFLWSFVRRVYYTGSCRRVRNTAQMQDILHGAQRVYEMATLRRPSMFGNAPPNLEDAENPKQKGTSPLNSAGIGSDTPTTPAPSNFEIDDEFNLPISVAIFILVVYIFLGALMYSILEKWNFFAAFYFVFISMSTIGFGDYVPADPICMIASIVYLVFGLALMSMCINVVQVKLSDTFRGASSKLGATIGLNVDEEDGSITTVSLQPIEVPDLHSGVGANGGGEDASADLKKEIKSSLKMKADEKENEIEDYDKKAKMSKEVKF